MKISNVVIFKYYNKLASVVTIEKSSIFFKFAKTVFEFQNEK